MHAFSQYVNIVSNCVISQLYTYKYNTNTTQQVISKFITLFQVVNNCGLAASSGIKLLWRNASISEKWHKNRDLRGKFKGAKGDSAPFKHFYLYVTATINSMKMSFNNV